jgi:hypothetical protein
MAVKSSWFHSTERRWIAICKTFPRPRDLLRHLRRANNAAAPAGFTGRLVEFANGPVTGEWSAKRGAIGHPEPFNMKMMGVGNEQWGPQYIERYEKFSHALKEKYPKIALVAASGPDPGDDRFKFLWSKLRALNADIVDEHCYAAGQPLCGGLCQRHHPQSVAGGKQEMKVKLAFTLLVGLVGLCGCAHQYLMKLKDDDQIISYSKPKLQGTNYDFTDGSGAQHRIPKSRVVKVRAVSVVNEEEKPASSPSFPVSPKKPKHWYFLWLA